MATANEVLEQMEQHPELYASADVCIVDPVTRTISVPDAYRILGVESDESVKVVPFQCPKMVEDDVDLTDFTLYINYVNAGGDFGIYSIENVKESGENITFDWIIRRSVTARRGTIRFILCAKRSDDEGNIIQEWNTTINDECESLEGLEGAPSIADQFPDIIQQILEKLQEITGGGGGTGGTTNYNNLSNKPQLNGVTLEGNKTLDQVGVLAKNQGSNNSGKFLSVGSDGNVVPADAPSGGGDGSGTPGKDGREIQIQNNGTAIQWRYVGDVSWTDLVQLSEITGSKGDPGETPNIQIGTVQTLEPGQQATASMSGTAENPLLNLGIPKGEKGDSDGAIGANKVLSDSSEWINGNFIYQNENTVVFDILQNRITTKSINELKTNRIKVECNSGYKYRVLFFAEIKNVSDGSFYSIVSGGYDDYSTWHEDNRILIAPEESQGYAVCIAKTDDLEIDTPECENISIYEIADDFDNTDNTENIFRNIIKQYNGKILSILGDSISTYSGYIPSNNRSRYPEGDVDSVDKTYWKKIIDTLGMKLGVNESWAGSLVSWDSTTENNDIGENKHIASTTRISHLDDNGTPDIILIFAGTNDIGHEVEIGEINNLTYAENVSNLSVSTFSESYTTMIMRVQYYYPKSKILVLTPCFAKYTSYTYYTPDRLNQYIDKIIEVCEIMGVDIIDTRKIGFNMYNIDDFTIDGLHPNAKGMELLSDSILKKMWFKF